MIPNKMATLRKSYSIEFTALVTNIGVILADVVLPTNSPEAWYVDIPMPYMLNPSEGFLIRQELYEAGWAGSFRCATMTTEYLRVYLPVRT